LAMIDSVGDAIIELSAGSRIYAGVAGRGG
jgi:hypothetical protein